MIDSERGKEGYENLKVEIEKYQKKTEHGT